MNQQKIEQETWAETFNDVDAMKTFIDAKCALGFTIKLISPFGQTPAENRFFILGEKHVWETIE
jgi:hypothetical protein